MEVTGSPSVRPDDHQRLAVLDGLPILDQHLLDNAGSLGLDRTEVPHRLDTADDLAGSDPFTLLDRWLGPGARRASEDANHGRGHHKRIGRLLLWLRRNGPLLGAHGIKRLAAQDEPRSTVLNLEQIHVGCRDQLQQIGGVVHPRSLATQTISLHRGEL
jgi:hypothetical protein